MKQVFKIKYVIILLTLLEANLYSQSIEFSRSSSFGFSIDDIVYIYNRAFDIALRNNRNGLEHRSIFNIETIDIDVIVITVDSLLERSALNIGNIDELKHVVLWDSLGAQHYFNQIKIRNTFEIQKTHFLQTPVLHGNHLLHAVFSYIYSYKEYIYLGILLQFSTGQNINYPEWVIFQIERCNGKYVLFRKLFIPFGTDGTKDYYYTRMLDDYDCY